MSVKVIGGTMVGVFVPIAIEYAAQGADIPGIPLKWSGVVGIAIGAVPIVAVVAKLGPFRSMSQETQDAVIAFGAASLATGIAILILEQLRKNTSYTFKGRAPIGRGPPHFEGLQSTYQAPMGYTAPVGQVIKEI